MQCLVFDTQTKILVPEYIATSQNIASPWEFSLVVCGQCLRSSFSNPHVHAIQDLHSTVPAHFVARVGVVRHLFVLVLRYSDNKAIL